MQETIHTVFSNPEAASKAVGALLDHGVRPEDVSVYVKNIPSNWGVSDLTSGELIEQKAEQGITTTTMQDAVAGGAKGAGIAVGIGAIAAIAALMIPGFGLVLGGGALATAIGGVAATTAGGAVAGAVVGYLKDQGVDERVANTMGEDVAKGGVLVSVFLPGGDVPIWTIKGILAKYADQDDMIHEPIDETDREPVLSRDVPPPVVTQPF